MTMKKDTTKQDLVREVFEIIEEICCSRTGQINIMANKIKEMGVSLYNFFTGFPQILWKTRRTFSVHRTIVFVLIVILLSSCTVFKSSKKEPQTPMENAMMSMTEEEVRKRLGEPNIVSITPENKIIWTYRPSWKIMPDNKDTVYVEFESGKVVKIIKVR